MKQQSSTKTDKHPKITPWTNKWYSKTMEYHVLFQWELTWLVFWLHRACALLTLKGKGCYFKSKVDFDWMKSGLWLNEKRTMLDLNLKAGCDLKAGCVWFKSGLCLIQKVGYVWLKAGYVWFKNGLRLNEKRAMSEWKADYDWKKSGLWFKEKRTMIGEIDE